MTLAQAQELAETALEDHGLSAEGWRFEFDNAKRRFGCCSYNRKRITLSRHLVTLNNPLVVYNTILHEVAHALAGSGAGHGREWQATAKSIGCDGLRCYESTVIKPPKPWIGTCPSCNRTIERHKRNAIACGRCCERYNHNQFDEAYLFIWKRA